MKLNIQTRLFLGFTFLSTILVASSGYLYYGQSSEDLLKRAQETNRQQLYRYQEALTNMWEDMDRISAQVIYSSDIKTYLTEHAITGDNSFQGLEMRKRYEDLLRSFNGPWFIATQINLITTSGFFLTYGQDMSTVLDIGSRIEQADWIDEAIRLGNDKLLVPPHISEWQQRQLLYFSLVRSFNFPPVHSPAVVEVQQPYSLLEETMELGRATTSRSNVYVINDSGQLFYPHVMDKVEQPNIPRWEGDVTEMMDGDGGGKDIWSQLRSDYSGLTVLIQQPKSEVMRPINDLRKITWGLAIAGELISLVIAYVLSASLTSPIRYLQKRLEKLNLENVNTLSIKKLENTKEIGALYITFEQMRTRLNHSLNDVLQAQKRENLAHLHAMYAQMNPHFLFNTLTSMSSHAEESGFHEYARISQKLSGMLRYATTSVTNTVTLKQEMGYVTQYMELMQFRYETQFSFQFRLDPALEDEMVPKFLLQPLVENSFTHGFQSVRPPWIVEVEGSLSEGDDSWSILIRDNGSGFSEQSFQVTMDLIDELNRGQIRELEALSGHGFGKLGIVNTLTRCRLFWNDQVRFSLIQLARGMAFTIKVRRGE